MWFMPTFNRPEQCKAVIEQINKVGCSTSGIVFVQGREMQAEYEKALDGTLPDNWVLYFHATNIGCDPAMNWCFKNFPNEPFYGLVCDDEYVYTEGWDKILSEAAGEWNISHGNDGWQSENRIHSYVTVGGELVRACGWWSLPGLWHWFHDDVQEALAAACGLRVYCKDVKTEHKHYMAGKVQKDATYVSAEEGSEKDRQTYYDWRLSEFPFLVGKIMRAKRI